MKTAARLVHNARARSRRNGTPFDLSKEYVESIWPEDNRCPILGMELVAGRGGGKGGTANSPTLDRIIPGLGYVKGNVRICSLRANGMKQDADGETLIKFAEWILKNVTTS